MMTKLRNILALATLGSLFAVTSSAQNGYLMSRYGLGITDMAELSSTNMGFGTARSAGMGGAFTSLGADMSSMNINPAGLGLYRSSEFSISPSFTMGKYENKTQDVSGSAQKNRMSLDNIGVAFNVYQGGGNLTSVTFGIGYNKTADLNFNRKMSAPADMTSISDIFEHATYGVDPSDISPNNNRRWIDFHESYWGGILGYNTNMIDHVGNDGDGSPMYGTVGFGSNAIISHSATARSKGHIGDYNFAAGLNFKNRVYLGLSIGIQDIYQKQHIYYSEGYEGTGSGEMNSMDYVQNVKVVGDATNFKFGVIVSPLDGLRIGAAVHSPSYVSMEKSYSASMVSRFNAGSSYSALSDRIYSEYEFRTPTRLLLGASYVITNRALVSFDYERMWYNGMRVDADDGWVESDFRQAIKSTYKPRDVFRVGGEYKLTPALALRGGFAHYGSFLKDKNAILDAPVAYKGFNITGGLGYRVSSNFSMDMAYAYMKSTYSNYDLYYYNNNVRSAELEQELFRHNIIMTFSYRF